jgi:hypothetical protein
MAWIGVDLDGTLAEYGGWRGKDHIGAPIAPMVARIKNWLAQGTEVRVFTARVAAPHDDVFVKESVALIQAWCLEHIGVALPVTCEKDFGMIELWDDRAVRVVFNTGEACCHHHKELRNG